MLLHKKHLIGALIIFVSTAAVAETDRVAKLIKDARKAAA